LYDLHQNLLVIRGLKHTIIDAAKKVSLNYGEECSSASFVTW
jgi:hypothetical protein